MNRADRRLCGNSLTNAPKWVGTAGVNWEFGHAGDLSYFVNASLRYESDRRTTTQWRLSSEPTADTYNIINPFDVQKSNVKVNLRAGIRSAENVSFELWAQNLFNEHTRHVTFNIPLRGTSAGPVRASRGAFMDAPRTYGGTIRVSW